MGEKVKRKYAMQFRHLQDEAYGALADANLFSSRQQLIAHGFRCRPNGHPVSLSAKVTLMPQTDGHVLVLCGNSLVGEVLEEDCATLLAINCQEPVLLVGEISEQSSITGDFLVVCGPEVDEDGVNDDPNSGRR